MSEQTVGKPHILNQMTFNFGQPAFFPINPDPASHRVEHSVLMGCGTKIGIWFKKYFYKIALVVSITPRDSIWQYLKKMFVLARIFFLRVLRFFLFVLFVQQAVDAPVFLFLLFRRDRLSVD